eukprot:7385285-Prymnesium_polylepis.2
MAYPTATPPSGPASREKRRRIFATDEVCEPSVGCVNTDACLAANAHRRTVLSLRRMQSCDFMRGTFHGLTLCALFRDSTTIDGVRCCVFTVNVCVRRTGHTRVDATQQ